MKRILPLLLVGLAACGSPSAPSAAPASSVVLATGAPASAAPAGRGFPAAGPWASYYGPAADVDPAKMAEAFRILDIDADPGAGNWTPAQIAALKKGGANRVLSYLDIGSIERGRSYFAQAPASAYLGVYDGYPDEEWMNPADPGWARLLLATVVPQLVATGVDGVYLDNLELLGQDDPSAMPYCDATCSQAGLELVASIRKAYPDLLIVMQNGTSDVTLAGTTSLGPYARLLDGVAHEDVFTSAEDTPLASDAHSTVTTDDEAVTQLRAWRDAGLTPGGRPFWVAVEDYVNSCGNTADAARVRASAAEERFSVYVSDTSAGQGVVCYPS